MSWTEKGKIVSTSSDLVVRAKFGRILHFPHDNGYKEGDELTLVFGNNGQISILNDEHHHSLIKSEEYPEPEELDYNYYFSQNEDD